MVAVELFCLDKKMMHQDLIGLLQCIGDVVLEGLSSIKSKHHLKVELNAVAEGVPSFGGSLGVGVSEDILPRSFHHLSLHCLLLRLPGLVGEKIAI